jgi:hypothetical protein
LNSVNSIQACCVTPVCLFDVPQVLVVTAADVEVEVAPIPVSAPEEATAVAAAAAEPGAAPVRLVALCRSAVILLFATAVLTPADLAAAKAEQAEVVPASVFAAGVVQHSVVAVPDVPAAPRSRVR